MTLNESGLHIWEKRRIAQSSTTHNYYKPTFNYVCSNPEKIRLTICLIGTSIRIDGRLIVGSLDTKQPRDSRVVNPLNTKYICLYTPDKMMISEVKGTHWSQTHSVVSAPTHHIQCFQEQRAEQSFYWLHLV